MLSPDVMIDDGKGTVLLSSEEDETEGNMAKMLTVGFRVVKAFFHRTSFSP